MAKQAPQLLTVKQIMERTGLSQSSVYRLLDSRALPTVRVLGTVRVSEDELDAFIRSHTHHAQPER